MTSFRPSIHRRDRLNGGGDSPCAGATRGVVLFGILISMNLLLILGALLHRQWVTGELKNPPLRPSLDSLRSFYFPEPAHVMDRDGKLVAHLEDPAQVWTPLDSVSHWVVQGVIAVEDRRFREHRGVDLRAVGRAAIRNLRSWDVLEGASTVTMQLSRNLWANRIREMGPWRRKLLEVRLAREVEAHLTKEEILELYLNRIFWGHGIYGIGAASIHYFGKAPSRLSLPEAATLVGMIKTPNRYDPRGNPGEALNRRNRVLEDMVEVGFLDRNVAEEAGDAPLDVTDSPPVRRGESYYLDAVEARLEELVPDPRHRAGVRIYTEWDTRMQDVAERRLRGQIRRIERGEVGPYDGSLPPDSLEEARGPASPYLQGAVVILDQETGGVRALVGGRDFHHSRFNRAIDARRQPGSAFKPMVYAAALRAGKVTLSSWIDTGPWKSPESSENETGEKEAEWNPSDDVETDSMALRRAFYVSSNRAAIRVGLGTGMRPIVDLAGRMGLETPPEPHPSYFLGAFPTTPLQMAAAYTPFGSGGYKVQPRIIRKIEDRHGRTLYRAPPRSRRRVVDPAVAFLVRSAMEDVLSRGTAWRIRNLGYRGPGAGKTGTTNSGRDVWFVGVTGALVMTVWMGFDHPSPLPHGSGGRYAAPVWGRIAGDLGGETSEIFQEWRTLPEGVTRRRIDTRTGFTVPEGCSTVKEKDTRVEYYLEGTEPREVCPCTRDAFSCWIPPVDSRRREGGGRLGPGFPAEDGMES